MDTSFKKKLILLIGSVLIALNLAIFAGSKLILSESFERLEQDAVAENLQRAVNAVNSDLESLGAMTRDWSVWDDTYTFIKDHNLDYIESNLVDTSFIDLSLNVILLIDATGQLVYGRAMDLEEGTDVEVPPDLLEKFSPGRTLWSAINETNHLEGLYLLPQGPILVSANTILTSEGEGPSRGLFVMGRWLDDKVVSRLAERTELVLEILPFVRGYARDLLPPGQKTSIRIDPTKPSMIRGYSALNDAEDMPALLLSLQMNRDVYRQGTKTIAYFSNSFLAFSLLSGLVLYLLLVRGREEYAESERRFRYVFENATNGLFVVDMKGKVRSMNSAAEGLLEVKGRIHSWDAIPFLAKHEGCSGLIRKGLEGNSVEGVDLSIPGSERHKKKHLLLNAAPLMEKNKQGRQFGVIVTVQDNTEQKEADLLKSEFVATAAHELKTPLASIIGFSEIMLTEKDIDKFVHKGFLEIIMERSRDLERTVDDLLNLGKMETSGELILEKSSYDLRQSFEAQLAIYLNEAPDYQFVLSLPEGEIKIVADRQRVKQVLDNLIGNAIKYSDKGGLIQVQGRVNDGELEIRVIDQGIGIQPEDLARIFDKYFRADNATAVSGLGLGLSISKNIVEKHGGEIWIENRQEKGTCACFTLPLT